MLMTTPMSSTAIFWGKWLGAFRGVLLISIRPFDRPLAGPVKELGGPRD